MSRSSSPHEPAARTEPPRLSKLGKTALGSWLLITLLACAACLAGFQIDNSVGIWFETDDPALTEYRRYLDDFGHREWMLVAPDRSPGNATQAAADLDELASRLRALDHVHLVLSTRNLPEQSDLVRSFLRPDPNRAQEALLLQVTNDIDTEEGYREMLVTAIRDAAGGLPSIREVHAAGIAVINGELNRVARRDMFLFFPTVTLFVALIAALIFRNARDTTVLLGVSLGTVLVTQGLLIGLGTSLNMITIMLPTVLIALSVADAVHLIQSFHGFRTTEDDAFVAARLAVKDIAWPCAGTTLTTVAGFLAFSGSSVIPVHQLAVFASVGIGFAYVLTVTVAPILLALLWRNRLRTPPPAAMTSRRLLGRWWRLVDRRPGWIAAACALSALSLLGLISLKADTDYVAFFRGGARVPVDYLALEKGGFPQNPFVLVIRSPEGERLTAEEYRAPLETFSRELEELPGVRAVMSPFLRIGMPSGTNEMAGSELGLFDQSGRQVQFVVMTDYPSSRWLSGLLTRIDELARRTLPGELTLTPTGTSILWAHMDDGVVRTQKESLAIVSLVCFAILILLFRSIGLALLGLVLSLLPVGIVLGLMGHWGIPVNMATVLIAGIAVGLAVDDAIHLIHAFREGRRRGRDARAASETALEKIGLRMIMTSLVLVGAFAVMGLSDFVPTSHFGLLSSLTILLALVLDLTVLPVLLSNPRRLCVRESLAADRSARAMKGGRA